MLGTVGRRCLIVAAGVALLAGLPLAPSRASHYRMAGEEFTAPYASGHVAHRCSSGLTCDHVTKHDVATGSLRAEMRAKPNPGSLTGSGTASAMSFFTDSVYLPAATGGLRVTVDFRVLKESTVSGSSPAASGEVGVFLNVHKTGCSAADCAASGYQSVLTASPLDDKPSSLADDGVVRLTVDLLKVNGGAPPAGFYSVGSMTIAHLGHPTIPSTGTASATAAVMVERVRTEVLASA